MADRGTFLGRYNPTIRRRVGAHSLYLKNAALILRFPACLRRPTFGEREGLNPVYPLLLRVVDFTVSTTPPTQGIIAATELIGGGRDDMVLSSWVSDFA